MITSLLGHVFFTAGLYVTVIAGIGVSNFGFDDADALEMLATGLVLVAGGAGLAFPPKERTPS